MTTREQETREARADLKQTQETSLPNALPDTPPHQRLKPNYGRTAGIAGAIIVLVIVVVLFAIL